MKILVIGSGGREHALAWKLAQSPRVADVLVAPGNAGTAAEAKCRNAPVRADDLDGLLELAEAEDVDLTVVGPEVPLVAGVVDLFEAAGRRIFGPRRAAAEIEGSKAFSKEFLARHGIPTAAYGVFTDLESARAFVAERGAPIVVKADGLAAGKGVVVARSVEEADAALVEMLSDSRFGSAGARVVIEEFLEGEEASFIVIAAGTQYQAMASSQDHKRRDDADLGPNTGGMGAYSPAPVVTPEIEARIRAEVIEPTLRGLLADDRGFTGFLYAGVMIADDGTPGVLEFNVRFGDPETQPIMMRLQSDLLELIEAALDHRLDACAPEWDPRPSLGVVMAAAGYPDSPRRGDPIRGLEQPDGEDTKVFHAGTAVDAQGQVITAGGRVLTVCALAETVVEARRRAYARVASIEFDGAFCRRDIAWRAVARETGEKLA
jgi:phosphoribosylamine---glycine ligase